MGVDTFSPIFRATTRQLVFVDAVFIVDKVFVL